MEPSLVSSAKRNCALCAGRKFFRGSEKYREMTQEKLRQLREHYLQRFQELRRKEEETPELGEIMEKKTMALDLIDACAKCDRSEDRVNRALTGMK